MEYLRRQVFRNGTMKWIPSFGLVADLLRLAQHGETMLVNIEIATAAFGGLAMTYFNRFFGGNDKM